MNKKLPLLIIIPCVGFVLYKNRNKIIKSISNKKIATIVNELSNTAESTINGFSDTVNDLYEYISPNQDMGDDFNADFWNEVNKEIEDVSLSEGVRLRSMADNLMVDIYSWDNQKENYQNQYTQIGKMPISSFIKWYNYLNIKNDSDFIKITNMMNIMNQYNYPYDINKNTKRDFNKKSILYKIQRPPHKFISLNSIDYGNEPKRNFELTPKDLFLKINQRLKKLKK